MRMQLLQTGSISYSGVPAAFLPYARTADAHHALKPFVSGNTLKLDQAISRGEAAEVITALEDLQPTHVISVYTDVTTDAGKAAVSVMGEKKWMRAVSSTQFGFNQLLSPLEERQLLQKVMKDNSITILAPTPSTVTVHVDTQRTYAVPKLDLLQTVWNLLRNQYLYRSRLSDDEAGYRAAEALVDSLKDPYTVFMRPTSAQDFQTQLKGEVTGIGAQVEEKAGILTIVAPLPGSPAEKAGLQAGDQILSVNGMSLKGLSYEESVRNVRGPKGSTALLHIGRNGTEFDVSVVRDTVIVKELEWSMNGSIGVVSLHQFGEISQQTFRSEMQKLALQNPRAIILDLRNNPGGLLDVAGIVAGTFLPDGTVFASINTGTGGSIENDTTSGSPIFGASIPMVVLVNKGSASAAEIVSGALQDAGRAKVVGEVTFGKGTVQQVLNFNDGSSLKMTIAEWRTPKGRKIDGIGVTPDFAVSAIAGQDAVMQKALDLLR